MKTPQAVLVGACIVTAGIILALGKDGWGWFLLLGAVLGGLL